MKFGEAINNAVLLCEERGIDDPFYLFSVASDYVGGDLAGKDRVKMLFDLDKRLQLVSNIKHSGKFACAICKQAYPAFGSAYSKEEFCNFIDDLYCILTATPLAPRQL